MDFGEVYNFSEKNTEQLFKCYYYRLRTYASKIVDSLVVGEDIVQEVFLKLWEKKPLVKKSAVKSYIFIQTRNTCITYLRNEKIFNNRSLDVNASEIEYLFLEDFRGEEELRDIREQIITDVLNFIDELPPQTGRVFRYSRLEQLPYKEIASRLSVSEKAVEKHISIALKCFRRKFHHLERV